MAVVLALFIEANISVDGLDPEGIMTLSLDDKQED